MDADPAHQADQPLIEAGGGDAGSQGDTAGDEPEDVATAPDETVAVPEAVHVIDSPTVRMVCMQLIGLRPGSGSLTVTLVSVTLPSLVTVNA